MKRFTSSLVGLASLGLLNGCGGEQVQLSGKVIPDTKEISSNYDSFYDVTVMTYAFMMQTGKGPIYVKYKSDISKKTDNASNAFFGLVKDSNTTPSKLKVTGSLDGITLSTDPTKIEFE